MLQQTQACPSHSTGPTIAYQTERTLSLTSELQNSQLVYLYMWNMY